MVICDLFTSSCCPVTTLLLIVHVVDDLYSAFGQFHAHTASSVAKVVLIQG